VEGIQHGKPETEIVKMHGPNRGRVRGEGRRKGGEPKKGSIQKKKNSYGPYPLHIKGEHEDLEKY